MKFLILFLFISQVHAGIDLCRINPLCEQLYDESYQCSQSLTEEDCDKFVTTFEKLLEPQMCTKDGKQIRFAIDSCELKSGASSILYYDRLSKLPYAKALKLFSSKKLRNTMDGSVAELYKKISERDEKRLGKTLLPGKVIPECRDFEYIDFKKIKFNELQVEEANVNEFKIWKNSTHPKIVDTKNKKECSVKTLKNIDRIFKLVGQNVLQYESSSGEGVSRLSLIQIEDCKVLWETEWDAQETISGKYGQKVKVNNMKNSSVKQCEPCWNNEKEACLRIF